jgi:hypothetical protein
MIHNKTISAFTTMRTTIMNYFSLRTLPDLRCTFVYRKIVEDPLVDLIIHGLINHEALVLFPCILKKIIPSIDVVGETTDLILAEPP